MNTKLLINLLIFGIVGLLVWYGVMPAWNVVSFYRTDLAAKDAEVAKEKDILDKFNAANAVLLSNRANVQKLEQAIPVVESKPEIISIMQTLASQNGLSLIEINVEAVPQDTKNRKKATLEENLLKTLKVSIKMDGTYGSFKSWLEALEKSLRVFDVNLISFSPTSLSGGGKAGAAEVVNPVMEYNVSVNTYVIRDQ